MTGRWRIRVALVVVALGAVGCADVGGASRTGGPAPVLTLRLGTHDQASAPVAPVIRAFAEQVAELSGGGLRIEPVWEANSADGPPGQDWDQWVIRRVVSGELDLALVPTRAWDTEGVGSLAALSAPFLLDSHPLLAEVTRGDLADELLAGLEGAGVTGLALVPEGLRHVFAFDRPVLSPGDVAGRVLRTPRSDTGYAVFRSWGAVPEDLVGSELDAAVASGEVVADSSFARVAGLLGPLTTVAGNVTPSATVHTLVVRSSILAGLTGAQADVLSTAARAARDALLADLPDEAALAGEFCAAGGRVVTAGADDLAALQQAAEPVTRLLEQDPSHRAVLDRIRVLRAALPPPGAVPPCEPVLAPVPEPDPAAVPADTGGAFPEGVYRMEVSAEDLVAQGATPQDGRNHGGIWTMTFHDGRLVLEDRRSGDGQQSSSTGVYCVVDSRVLVADRQSGQCVPPVLFTAGWQLDGRELRFTEVRDGDDRASALFDALWGGQAWTRID